ncbi:hypothetical protein PWP93_16650 [Paraburkholderia sp. A1RI-2L]|uniref:hypothetical protein n=1 Tax=Paraburkholderia sp. A1RI-2L TaxID=3028367 RepID=UPI003B8251D1
MQSDAGAETRRSLDRKADLVATFVRANSCTLPPCYNEKKFSFQQIPDRSGTFQCFD